MAETMLIRCKTISNQSINHSGFFPPVDVGERLQEVKYIYRPIEHFFNLIYFKYAQGILGIRQQILPL